MSQKTRSVLTSDITTLFDPASPKVSKASHQILVQNFIDSCATELDGTWRIPILYGSRTPPETATLGDRILVMPTATDAFVAQEHKIAQWNGTAYDFLSVPNGTVLVATQQANVLFMKVNGTFTKKGLSTLQSILKSADTSITATVPASVIGAPAPNFLKGRNYLVRYTLKVKMETGGAGLNIIMDYPDIGEITWECRYPNASNTGDEVRRFHNTGGACAVSLPAVNVPFLVHITALVSDITADTYMQPLFGTAVEGVNVWLMKASCAEGMDTIY